MNDKQNIFRRRSKITVRDNDNFSNNSLQSVIIDVEYSIASFLIEESNSFEYATCRRTSGSEQVYINETEKATNTNNDREQNRTSYNVGIAIAPTDEPAFKCQSTEQDISCYEIAGAFQVH